MADYWFHDVCRPTGFESVYPALHKVADAPFHIQGNIMFLLNKPTLFIQC